MRLKESSTNNSYPKPFVTWFSPDPASFLVKLMIWNRPKTQRNTEELFESSDISNKISYQVALLDDRAPTSSVLGHNSTGVIWKRMGILHTDIISLCYQMTHMLFSTLVCGSRNGVSCHSPNNRTPLAREDILKMILCTCDSDQPCKYQKWCCCNSVGGN